jgi:polysaccharide export outer membrane protein
MSASMLTTIDVRSRKSGSTSQQRLAVRATLLAILILRCSTGGLAQENNLGTAKDASSSGLTGAGRGSSTTETAKAGTADGMGTLLLGGQRHPLYRIRPSDVVEISFTVSPEFNQTLTVQPDGYVSLKDVDMVFAQGLTLVEFTTSVRQAYHGYLHDPQVAVALKEFDHPYFIVGGEVGHPGKFELRSDTTVAEAVAVAGGFTSQSKHSQVVLFRKVNEEFTEARLLDVKKMLKSNNLKEDAHLRSGDFVFVPQNAISKIARYLAKPAMSMYVSPTQF